MTSFTPTVAGAYTVSLTATDDRGVSETRTATTIVTAATPPPAGPPPAAAVSPAYTAAGAAPGEPPVVTVFDAATGAVVRQFEAYEDAFRGGVSVAVGDVTGDGVPDIVTAPGVGGGPVIKVFDGVTGAEVRSFYAFDPAFRGGRTSPSRT